MSLLYEYWLTSQIMIINHSDINSYIFQFYMLVIKNINIFKILVEHVALNNGVKAIHWTKHYRAIDTLLEFIIYNLKINKRRVHILSEYEYIIFNKSFVNQLQQKLLYNYFVSTFMINNRTCINIQKRLS